MPNGASRVASAQKLPNIILLMALLHTVIALTLKVASKVEQKHIRVYSNSLYRHASVTTGTLLGTDTDTRTYGR